MSEAFLDLESDFLVDEDSPVRQRENDSKMKSAIISCCMDVVSLMSDQRPRESAQDRRKVNC